MFHEQLETRNPFLLAPTNLSFLPPTHSRKKKRKCPPPVLHPGHIGSSYCSSFSIPPALPPSHPPHAGVSSHLLPPLTTPTYSQSYQLRASSARRYPLQQGQLPTSAATPQFSTQIHRLLIMITLRLTSYCHPRKRHGPQPLSPTLKHQSLPLSHRSLPFMRYFTFGKRRLPAGLPRKSPSSKAPPPSNTESLRPSKNSNLSIINPNLNLNSS